MTRTNPVPDQAPGSPSRPLRIGLVNNMPDAALDATERQFRHLLTGGRSRVEVDLRLFHLPGIARGPAARDYLRTHYASVECLMREGVDALVVTGCEPKAAHFAQEPYWEAMAELVDWARTGTVSALWSCLAAHAAVFQLDGIERRPLAAKASGIFACTRVADHPLIHGLGETLEIPHSRLNTLAEDDLARAGYDLLTRSEAVGVDAFVKRCPSLFVFLQGHPEYDGNSLAREFRRDLARAVSRPGQAIPAMPQRYFDEPTVAVLTPYLAALSARRDADLPEFGLARHRQAAWHGAATGFYANWLALVAQTAEHGSMRPRRPTRPPHPAVPNRDGIAVRSTTAATRSA